ncbi:hypothetical protein S40288_11596 [Stachybotrys chartarum IBT 40288]|nr:hypothetical protein S40288_11596 [Stachybotrys chartarum IBT 40288]
MRCLAADEAWRRRPHTAPARHRTGDGDKPEGKREMHAWYTYLDIDAWTGAGSEYYYCTLSAWGKKGKKKKRVQPLKRPLQSSLPTILCNGNTAHCGAYQFPGKTGIYPLPPAAPSEIGHGCFHPAVDAGNHPPLSPGTWSRPQQPTATAPPLLHSATRREPPPPYLASRIIAQRPQAIVASAAPAPDR